MSKRIIKKSVLCGMLAEHFTYDVHVRDILTKFDEPDTVTGQTGTRKTLERVKNQVVHAVLHETVSPTQLVGCAIDLLVVAYILKHGKP